MLRRNFFSLIGLPALFSLPQPKQEYIEVKITGDPYLNYAGEMLSMLSDCQYSIFVQDNKIIYFIDKNDTKFYPRIGLVAFKDGTKLGWLTYKSKHKTI